MNRISKLIAVLALISAPCILRGADIPINPSGPTYKIPGIQAWGVSGPAGLVNSFFFTPFYQTENVCVYVYNNNPTNAHTFTANISVTGDPNASGGSTNASWQIAYFSSTLTAGAAIANPAQFSSAVSGVAQVSIGFNAGTLAGNPDTATVVVIQTQGPCFAGIGANSSNPLPVLTYTQLQEFSEAFSQSFSFIASVVNPASGQMISDLLSQAVANRNLYYDRVVITSSAAATININLTSDLGTTCSGGTAPKNLKLGTSTVVTAQTILAGPCAVNPTVSQATYSNIAISTVPLVIDLRGFIAPAGSNNGIDVVMAAALTGTITVTWLEAEK